MLAGRRYRITFAMSTPVVVVRELIRFELGVGTVIGEKTTAPTQNQWVDQQHDLVHELALQQRLHQHSAAEYGPDPVPCLP